MTAAFKARKRKNNQIGTLRKPGQSAKVGVVLQKKKNYSNIFDKAV